MPDLTELLRLWAAYRAAVSAEPYNADEVQSWGFAFQPEWAKHKAYFRERYGEGADEYQKALLFMPRIVADHS